MSDQVSLIMDVLNRNLQSIWESDIEAYRATTADDVSFYEWYVSPQRIDGIDFHLRELKVHNAVLSDNVQGGRMEHEILQPRMQVYGDVAIVTYTLLLRVVSGAGASHKSHNETRVFHNFGTAEEPQWKLVHCHKSPIVTPESMRAVRG